MHSTYGLSSADGASRLSAYNPPSLQQLTLGPIQSVYACVYSSEWPGAAISQTSISVRVPCTQGDGCIELSLTLKRMR